LARGRLYFEGEAIVEELHSGGEKFVGRHMFEVVAHVGEPGMFCPDAPHNIDGLVEAHVGGVGRVAESAGDKDFDALERCDGFIGYVTDIGKISKPAKPETYNRHAAMHDGKG